MSRWLQEKGGQAIVFLLMVLVILSLVLLWNIDLHNILKLKNKSTTAGDAAALSAARFQAHALNLVGELNIMQAIALCNGDTESVNGITNMQARLCFTGPMTALVAAQVAAKNNGMYANDAFTQELLDHAGDVTDYTLGTAGGEVFPEPYPDAWSEYASMIRAVASQQIAAAPDNARYYTDRSGGHILLSAGFYDAIASRNWCWFFKKGLLENYQNFFPCWWPDLPPPPESKAYANSEYYGLDLMPYSARLPALADPAQLNEVASAQEFGTITPAPALTETIATWYTYGDNWGDWSIMSTDGPYPYPIAGPLKPKYNYAGADAVTRLEIESERISPSAQGGHQQDAITWTSAAKPFGYLEETMRPTALGVVVPAFRDVRLIPVSAASGSSGGAFDLDWRVHTEYHLPKYMEGGPNAVSSSCYYCRQLKAWESSAFRMTGFNWLQLYSEKCIVKPKPGDGGRRRGGGGDTGDPDRGGPRRAH